MFSRAAAIAEPILSSIILLIWCCSWGEISVYFVFVVMCANCSMMVGMLGVLGCLVFIVYGWSGG